MSTAQISRGMERGILLLFLAAAALIGVALALPSIRQIVAMVGGDATIHLLTTAELPHRQTGNRPAEIVSATFDSAALVARGLGGGTHALLIAGAVASAVTTLLVTAAVAYFVLLLLWRRPFHRSLILTTQVAGAALLLGGILSGGLTGLGRMMAADELNPLAGDVFTLGFTVDVVPLVAGACVLALSAVFGYGTRLQRETEGLV
jgi:hypothetical protein